MTYDTYDIWEKDDNGTWIRVEIGGVADAENGRQQAKQARQQANETVSEGQGAKGKPGATKQPRAKGNRASTRTDSEVWQRVKEHSRKSLTPLQLRINEAKARARAIIDEKKARGE